MLLLLFPPRRLENNTIPNLAPSLPSFPSPEARRRHAAAFLQHLSRSSLARYVNVRLVPGCLCPPCLTAAWLKPIFIHVKNVIWGKKIWVFIKFKGGGKKKQNSWTVRLLSCMQIQSKPTRCHLSTYWATPSKVFSWKTGKIRRQEVCKVAWKGRNTSANTWHGVMNVSVVYSGSASVVLRLYVRV